MWSIRKILVATDFGEPSKAAADLALDLAQRWDVPVVLVHTYLVPAGYAGVPAPPFADYARAFDDAAQELLQQEGLRLANRGTVVTTLLRVGTAWEEILAAAKQLEVGLIVMGTHGRHGLPRALLGSVAEKVVRLSPVPVLTVHETPNGVGTAADRAGAADTNDRPNVG